jgi:hypothetical protein
MAEEHRGGDAFSMVYLIGWRERENRPAAYSINLSTAESTHRSFIESNSLSAGDYGRLKEQVLAGTPLPSRELLDAACFTIHEDDERFVPDADLLHMMEVQRHEEMDGHHWVGGKCVLTTVAEGRVTQKVVHHWVEDVVGRPIEPKPIADWRAWRAALDAAHVKSVVPEGMSRLQRDVWERKQRKLNRRAA